MPDNKPQSHTFGGGISQTTIHPVALAVVLIAMLLILVLPRKYAIFPLLCAIFFVPLGQSVFALGVHWLAPRIIVLTGLLRVAILKAQSKTELITDWPNPADRAFIGCVLCEAVAFVLLYRQTDALVNQFGFLIDFLCAYVVLRVLIKDEADVYRALKCMAVITVVLGLCMVREQLTVKNIFGLLGGFPLVPEIREGKIRSQASFQHSLTAGTFAATLVPLFLFLWVKGRARLMSLLGLFGCTVMTICSNSSTPLLAYVAGVFAICFWPFRRKMRAVRWGMVVSLLLLQLCMKAPVWMLIARVDLTGGSSGYHRAELVDQFIRHFSDWWLIGTKDAATWGWDLWDQQNQYVDVGETGGLAAFVLFIAMITRACARIGNARKLASRRKEEWGLWLLGSAMFANLVGFFGINYFDQSKVGWFVLLAAISAATAPFLRSPEPKATELEFQPEFLPEVAVEGGVLLTSSSTRVGLQGLL